MRPFAKLLRALVTILEHPSSGILLAALLVGVLNVGRVKTRE